MLFSRSLEDDKANGDKVAEPSAAGQAVQKQNSPRGMSAATVARFQATDAERNALTFLAYDLDVRLVPRQESIAVRARLRVRNDGDKPLERIALQLSSALKWEQMRTAGAGVSFAQHLLDSDADHTGAVNEAVITLPRALAPQEELQLEVLYSGQISLNGERLERIGAPTAAAEKSDWDRISADFVGMRGFGNVLWYPVSAPPVLLGDGAKLFAEMGKQKQRQQQATMKMSVTAEFTAEIATPNLALLNGHVVPVVETAAPENSHAGVITASLPETTLGFSAPSLFLLARRKVQGSGVQIFAAAEDVASTQSLQTAVREVTPLVQQWLGQKPNALLTVVGLAEANDAPAEERDVFLAGFKASPDPHELDNAMVHSLAHAYFASPRPWLNEGVAQFLGSLWVEQVDGRKTALESMASERGALSLAEPATPGETGGEDLLDASDPVFYRTKSVYVLWMLRDLAGDAALAAALRSYHPEQDTTSDYFERLLEKASGKDLKWFFDAWIYHDRGLADLSITGVFPSKASVAGQWLVAVDIANDGFAEVEVPVIVRSRDTTVAERLRVPARGTVSHRMLIGSLPTEIQVNDGTVPEVAESIHLHTLTAEAK
ncbi:hypothetical protein ACPOL_1533 [Acidisarcina polymorpha]|uniref:Peptidase M1 membrane alanine aminopeptidase domain-containing protein n=1 Tax=Acidisarcina polymorpha TaxID=2211140 RepID=A0A2Z5FVF6_9BACT|nr:hypothetical protein ACPOL_1533 [Acidisarcina polymorpha]